MQFRQFVAQLTIALIQGNTAGIAARNPDDRENIVVQEMIWSAVSVARSLETSGLAPWNNDYGKGHKDAGEASKFFVTLVKKAKEAKKAAEEATKKANEAGMDINITPEAPTESVLGLGR